MADRESLFERASKKALENITLMSGNGTDITAEEYQALKQKHPNGWTQEKDSKKDLDEEYAKYFDYLEGITNPHRYSDDDYDTYRAWPGSSNYKRIYANSGRAPEGNSEAWFGSDYNGNFFRLTGPDDLRRANEVYVGTLNPNKVEGSKWQPGTESKDYDQYLGLDGFWHKAGSEDEQLLIEALAEEYPYLIKLKSSGSPATPYLPLKKFSQEDLPKELAEEQEEKIKKIQMIRQLIKDYYEPRILEAQKQIEKTQGLGKKYTNDSGALGEALKNINTESTTKTSGWENWVVENHKK